MAKGTILPFARPQVTRRSVEIAAQPKRPDMDVVLNLLNAIDPALLARVAPHAKMATAGPRRTRRNIPESSPPEQPISGPAPAPEGATDDALPCPPPPANCGPHLPRPRTSARVRALTSLVFPDGSSCIVNCTLPRLNLMLCLR